MKAFFRYSLVALILLLTIKANAQVGFRVGYLSTNEVKTESAVGGTDNAIYNNGFYANVNYDLALPAKAFSLEASLGYSFLEGSLGGMKTTYHNVNIPFHIKGEYDSLGSEAFPFALYAFAGPLFTIGISAIENHDGNPYLTEKRVSMYDKVLNRFDMKFSAGFGMLLAKHFDFRFGYAHGLMDIAQDKNHNTKMSYIYFGVGYKF